MKEEREKEQKKEKKLQNLAHFTVNGLQNDVCYIVRPFTIIVCNALMH